jgi:ParB family chromosome partitioning protein
MMYVIETNLMQRSFADMAHSEKAAIIAAQHSKLFSQGKRNDILAELKVLENPHEYKDNGTFAQLAQKFHSDRKVAEMYSLSKDTIARYLRIDKLIPSLKTRLDNGEIAFIPAVTLSFLREEQQEQLDYCLELNGIRGFRVDMTKANILREYSDKGKLDPDSIFCILTGEIRQKPKSNRTPTVKIGKTVYARYFKPEQTAAQVQKIVEAALAFYYRNRHNE